MGVEKAPTVVSGISVTPNAMTRNMAKVYNDISQQLNVVSDIFTHGIRPAVDSTDLVSRWNWTTNTSLSGLNTINDVTSGLDGTSVYLYGSSDYKAIDPLFLVYNVINSVVSENEVRPVTLYEGMMRLKTYVQSEISNNISPIINIYSALEDFISGDIDIQNGTAVTIEDNKLSLSNWRFTDYNLGGDIYPSLFSEYDTGIVAGPEVLALKSSSILFEGGPPGASFSYSTDGLIVDAYDKEISFTTTGTLKVNPGLVFPVLAQAPIDPPEDHVKLYYNGGDFSFHYLDEGGASIPLGGGSGSTGLITFDQVKIMGAGTGSGDGLNASTIELVPDDDLYEITGLSSSGYGSAGGQYLVIDPTSPYHIHVRAGGEIDRAAAWLILGGEKANVTVADQDTSFNEKHYVTINTHAPGISTDTYRWRFHDDGATEFPALNIDLLVAGVVEVEGLQFANNSLASVITGAIPTIDVDAPPIIVQGQSHASGTGKGGDIYLWGGKSTADGGDIDIKAGTSSTAGLSGEVSIGAGGYDWVFKNNGVTRFPYLDVDLLLGGSTPVETLKFSNNAKKSVITGATPASGDAATALIMQGQGSIGNAGGDVCLWAGNSTLDAGNVSIIGGTTTDALGGSAAGTVVLEGGGSSDAFGGDVRLRAGAGDVASLNGKVSIENASNTWSFNNDGTTSLPTLDVNLHNWGVESAEVLQFSGASTQCVITGPTPLTDADAQRIIIQGQRGIGTGEGGDVYLWGGDSESKNGGDIKIYAGDADSATYGVAPNLHQGGYVYLKGGTGYDSGGPVTLIGGYSAGGTGGNVELSAGGGTYAAGEVIITSNSNTWTFGNDGHTIVPNTKDIRDFAGNTLVGGGNRVKNYNSSSGAVVPVDENNIYVITTTSAATNLKLPLGATTPIGYEFIVVDKSGNAASKNITITAESADTIISAPSGIAINTNYGLLAFKYVGGNNWIILYGR